ncbi:MAG: class I SAM-dependent methyltransferase [Acidimicrobiales bacterium]
MSVLVPPTATKVLDVGCSVGVLASALRDRGHRVTGIEADGQLAQMARSSGNLEKLIEADVEQLARDGADPGGPFDCVVMADVLEHLRDPWAVVRWASRVLGPDGSVVISVPNIRHLETFWSLLVKRRWPYKPVGIFDRSHLRWFAYGNLTDLLAGTDLQIAELNRTRSLVLNGSERINRLAPYLGDLGTLQFIFRAEREGVRRG